MELFVVVDEEQCHDVTGERKSCRELASAVGIRAVQIVSCSCKSFRNDKPSLNQVRLIRFLKGFRSIWSLGIVVSTRK